MSISKEYFHIVRKKQTPPAAGDPTGQDQQVPGASAGPDAGTDVTAPAGVRLRDAKGLRAFAHPLRVALITALRVHGPLTATQASALVDDSPSNCSFHLRTLASFGLIEQIPGPDARQRLWQVVRGGISFEPDDDAESKVAAKSAAQVFHTHTTNALYRWIDQESDAPQEWQDAWFDSNWTVSITAAELAEISAGLDNLVRPYVERRRVRGDLPGETPVSITGFAFPHVMPPSSETEPPTTPPTA